MTNPIIIGSGAELHLGDCLQTLRQMPDNSVDSIVTDPPYGLSFMGKKWDYDVPTVEIWAECLRVLKPGGHLLAFAGTRTQHRMAVRIEDAGFEIRDMLAWIYGSGFPKSHNGPWGGTALKPAIEPITLARKPLIGTVAANWQEYGTGALNIDGCRVAGEGAEAGRTRHGGGTANTYAQDEWTKANLASMGGNPMPDGRWPANLIHDGSDEVVELFPANCKTGKGGGAGMGFHGGEWPADSERGYGDTGSAARFFYCAKASRRDRNEGCDSLPQRMPGNAVDRASPRAGEEGTAGRGSRSGPRENHHPTVKPTDLMAYLCRLVTPPGGVVLDPFMGSGSTGKAALREGLRFIGCELSPDYMAIAEARILHAWQAANPVRRPVAV